MPVDIVRDYRKAGEKRLKESGYPDLKTEHWRKFDISDITTRKYSPALSEPERSGALWNDLTDRIDIINGVVLQKELSSRYIISKDPQMLGSAGDERGDYYYDVNSSSLSDFIVITVKKGQKDKPLYLHQHINGGDSPVTANPRIIIHLEEDAELDLIQSFSSTGKEAVFHNSVTEILMERESRIEHLVLQEERGNVHVFNHLYIKQLEKSRYRGRTLTAGASLSRNEFHISLKEEECETSIDNLYLGLSGRNHNSDITIYHDAPRCTSHMEARAIAMQDSLGTFRGFAKIAKDSQKSDAVQQFKTILLDESAQVNMEPHLEIWADDVKCSHGATVGQLDEKQLFYLQTRGFTRDQAGKILLEAFGSRTFDDLSMGEIGNDVRARVFSLMEGLYEQR